MTKSRKDKAPVELQNEVKDFLTRLTEEASTSASTYQYFPEPNKTAVYQELKKKPPIFQIELIFLVLNEFIRLKNHKRQFAISRFYKSLLSLVFRRKLPFSQENLTDIISFYLNHRKDLLYYFPMKGLIKNVENFMGRETLEEDLKNLFEKLKYIPHKDHWGELNSDQRAINANIDRLLLKSKGGISVALDNDKLGLQVNTYLSSQKENLSNWDGLVLHFTQNLSLSKPTQKWRKITEKFVQEIGQEQILQIFSEWIQIATELYKVGVKNEDPKVLSEMNEHFVRNIVWSASILKEEELIEAIEDLGLACMKKVKGYGQISRRIGNACLWSFGNLPFQMGIQRLTKFRSKTNYSSIKSIIANRIKEVAKREGKTAEEIEEIGVGFCGLNSQHQIEQNIGDFKAIVSLDGLSKVSLNWEKSNGKIQKSIPAQVKEEHGETLKQLRRQIKDIKSALPAQRDRIERFFLMQRTWKFEDWFPNYISHPLVGYIGKRLIWFFQKENQKTTAIFHDGQWINQTGEPIDWIDETVEVQLWHPIGFSADYILEWRNMLINKEIQQPIKQAFREVYIITDAELNTESYSNRFAGHILKQFQFNTLCQVRGWQYTLQGNWDSHNTPTKYLKDWEIRVEFWVDADHNGSTASTGIFDYIFTDQVRFYKNQVQLNMHEVPALVFSEMMRDVDMFVGVTSIGNDLNWADRGNDQYHNYWHQYSFKELSQSSKERKTILERLIPLLKIAKKCSFTEKHLVVKGDLRTYKIHCGSGNILMEPNDQYLCIVPERNVRKNNKVFLPFEGDQMLSVILSKAFLLADDKKITDPTIVRQLEI